MERDALDRYLPGSLGHRVRAALEVRDSGTGAVELEDGRPVTP